MENNRKRNSVEDFIYSEDYQKASLSECPDNKCKDCGAFFTFENRTRCYVYEQQRFKDVGIEFNPRQDYNCNYFNKEWLFDNIIAVYKKALAKGIDPNNDIDYQSALEEDNKNFEILQKLEKETCAEEDEEDWNDPSLYANCSDWEVEPENCYHCSEDECPMNRG